MGEGLVVKAYGGYCFVQDGSLVIQCTLRGRLKAEGAVVVGDRVRFSAIQEGRGVVEDVLPRTSLLHRPAIANVDQIIIVVAFHDPEPVLNLVDRMLVLSEASEIVTRICLNKTDLAGGANPEWLQVYRGISYGVLLTSAVAGDGIERLGDVLRARISVFAGQSGVGKSSLINRLIPGLELRTGTVSRKLKRGRHVTRHVELLRLDQQSWVADAPGFSSLRLPNISREMLADLFPEMRDLRGRCRFHSCLHDQEPDCAVKNAVANNTIAEFRYRNYIGFLHEVIAAERRY
ncbi:MAG: ribosome small subunit-dependent GTPase A [Clostridia bacterium]|nr:ribosome small subunit-dependent GTPase A [Clostridia bacterium]MDQ7791938.1 ribosome small subunit-dependent GTPase A [Clostridia bacterium]